MKFEITEQDKHKRIDKFLAEHLENLSRSQIQKIIESSTKVNSEPTKKNYKLQEGDLVEIKIPEPESSELEPIKEDLDIAYEDAEVMVINKAPFLPVHPDKKKSHKRTLVNLLLGNKIPLSTLGGNDRPGIVHRLDMDTSGLVIIAKTDKAYKSLREQFEAKKVKKIYTTLIIDTLRPSTGKIEAPIGRDPEDRKKMKVRTGTGSKEAITEYKVKEVIHSDQLKTSFSLLEVKIPTGRTHQLRVHMARIIHPIICDTTYCYTRLNKKTLEMGLDRQFLHATKLEFTSPETGEKVKVESELPEELESFLGKLKNS